jgi:hypothetical protein
MTSLKSLSVAVLATWLTCAFSTDHAQAQSRVFVAAQGSDSNNCSFAAPCRTFQHAHDVAAANGEIDVLDPAGYGTVTVTKPISIQGHDFSGISVPNGGTGITINAGPQDKISLRGLIIEGAGVGSTGMKFVSGASLVVENCVVRNLVNSGISIVPTTGANVAISNTLVTQNGSHGIVAQPSASNPVRTLFNRVEVIGNSAKGIAIFGELMAAGAHVSAAAIDTVAAYNDVNFYATSSLASFRIFRSMSFRGTGAILTDIQAENGAFMTVSASNLEDGGWGGSNVFTYGDNYSDGVGSGGPSIATK